MTTPVPEALPTAYEYGRVIGRFLRAVGDGEDVDAVPEAVPATGTVTFTPIVTSRILIDASVEPSPLITHESITCDLDAYGHIARNGVRGVWLWTGEWTVSFNVSGMSRTPFPILVTTAHTDLAPLDLWEAAPYTPPAGATVTTMLVPTNPTDGYTLVWSASSGGLVWTLHSGSAAPALGADDNYVTDAEKAALHSHTNKTALDKVSGTNTGDQTLPTWSTLPGKPDFVASGSTAASARSAIGAGTSNLALGAGPSQAAAGDHTHALDALSDVSTTGATDGQALVKTPTGWAPGTAGGGGGSGVVVSDTPAAPAEGLAVTYWVTSAVTWPAGLVWSDDPDGGSAPTIASRALVTLVTQDGVTYGVGGSLFTAVDGQAPAWAATLTTGTPASTSVVVAASALATDNVGVTVYERSLDSGSTWAAIAPSGLNFALSGLSPSTAYPAPRLRAKDAAGLASPVLTAQTFTTAAPPADTTAPTPGTLAGSAITTSGFTLTVTGASDAGAGLHATPYAFSADNGATWSAWQASAAYAVTGKEAATGYTCRHKVRDAAATPNEATGTAITVTTAGSSWTPADLASLLVWLDASDAGTITASAGKVSQWADKSGNGYHATQATSANQPTTGTATLNGINALAFDGSDMLTTYAPTGTTNTILLVATPSSGTNDYLLNDITNVGTNSQAIITKYDGKAFEFYPYNTGTRFTIGTGAETGAHVVGYVRNGAAVTGRIDGAASGSGTPATGSGITQYIGCSPISADAMTGTLAEVVMCDAALTGTDLSNLEAYLKAKWGIA